MRKLAITLALTTTLIAVAVSQAAIPKAGPFAGKTSAKPINGFPDLVTFTAAKTGKSLTKFTFETLGCFGTGAFPVGVDPYGVPEAIAIMGTIPVTSTGSFLFTGKAKFNANDATPTTATIKGSFSSANAVSGTITITQVSSGDNCGPQAMKFTAVPGTP